MLPHVKPMKAVAGDLPESDAWAYEIKWDGMRLMAYLNDEGRPFRLLTTRDHDAVDRFPELVALPDAVGSVPAILDGEVVSFRDGRPDFGRLQTRIHAATAADVAHRAADAPACYLIFDLLHLDGHDLTGLPYTNRRHLLRSLIEDTPTWQVPPHHLDDGRLLLDAARAQGLEGVVAKRRDSRYLPGRRSPEWVKVKVRNRQEVVIGGLQPGAGNRTSTFGSLLVGYYEPDGNLRYGGRVGTGFSRAELARLTEALAAREMTTSPFTPAPPAAVARTARWARPELVCEVTFAHWTDDGILRHAGYLGLRGDKEPTDVVREEPASGA